MRFTKKRCKAWNPRNKAALAGNKYSYTYINPPIIANRMPKGGGTGVEVEGSIDEEVCEGDSR